MDITFIYNTLLLPIYIYIKKFITWEYYIYKWICLIVVDFLYLRLFSSTSSSCCCFRLLFVRDAIVSSTSSVTTLSFLLSLSLCFFLLFLRVIFSSLFRSFFLFSLSLLSFSWSFSFSVSLSSSISLSVFPLLSPSSSLPFASLNIYIICKLSYYIIIR